MKNSIKILGLMLVSILFLTACDTNPSLQKYYVDSKENAEFISVDLPASIIQLKDGNVSEEVKATLNTIKKVNFLALQLTEDNKDLYDAERTKVKAILKNPKFKQLLRMNRGSGSVTVNYLGEEDAIDEVVIFGSDKNQGFALVRVLGENMNPADILKITNDLQLDGDSQQLKQLEGIFKNISK